MSDSDRVLDEDTQSVTSDTSFHSAVDEFVDDFPESATEQSLAEEVAAGEVEGAGENDVVGEAKEESAAEESAVEEHEGGESTMEESVEREAAPIADTVVVEDDRGDDSDDVEGGEATPDTPDTPDTPEWVREELDYDEEETDSTAKETEASLSDDDDTNWGDGDCEGVVMSAAAREAAVEQASEHKKAGNALYTAGDYTAASQAYSRAIRACPIDETMRSVCFCNRAACRMQLCVYDKAITDCTKALKLDSEYTKAYLRRATAREKTDSLEDALKDYEECLKRDATNETARRAVRRLPTQIKEKNEKLKDEMLGKLKDIGNTILGKFGMSTDNFKMVEQPGGGYSLSFNQ